MSENEYKKRRQEREARLEIVASLYKRGHSVRKIRSEVMRRLNLDSYSLSTVQNDIKLLLKEWRESRLDDMDDALQLELTRIDDTVRELWEQWEKSKEDYVKTHHRRKGAPVRNEDREGNGNNNNSEGNIRTYSVEEETTNVVGLGNPSYISEIRAQLMERRKLLGLYAPEKREVSGNSFAAFLMESGMIEEAEQQSGLTQKK